MTQQLTLIAPDRRWRLDAKTRETGRKGIAEARKALAEHRPAEPPQRAA